MYVLGYSPIVAFGRSFKMLFRWPLLVSGVAMFWGYISGYFNRNDRILSKWFYTNIRIDQRNRMLTRIGLNPKSIFL